MKNDNEKLREENKSLGRVIAHLSDVKTSHLFKYNNEKNNSRRGVVILFFFSSFFFCFRSIRLITHVVVVFFLLPLFVAV